MSSTRARGFKNTSGAGFHNTLSNNGMKDKDCFYAFQVRNGNNFWSMGICLDTRVEAALALGDVMRKCLATDYPGGSILECYYAPKETEWPQRIWARIPLGAGNK